jgi:esterase/lipase superfamily enzyme
VVPPPPPQPVDPGTGVGFPVIKENRTIVPVFYGTDRDYTDDGNTASQYTSGRGKKLVYGYADVSIPSVHEIGQIERPKFWKLEFAEDPEKHIVITKIMPMDQVTFFDTVKSRLTEDTAKRVFVFIHGYNVPFDDALRRTAQIAYDLKYPGAPMLFSWPSFGEPLEYPSDAQNAAWAVPDLENFLLEVAANSGATQIDLIAHSMGNQALIAALQEITTKNQTVQFREIVLAAPDIDADIFTRAAPPIMSKATRVTLYASSNDQALKVSKKFNGFVRAGDSGKEIVVLPGMDTIDASSVDTSLLGHSYYGNNRSVLVDIDNLLRTNSPPTNRFGLFPIVRNGKQYWRFSP